MWLLIGKYSSTWYYEPILAPCIHTGPALPIFLLATFTIFLCSHLPISSFKLTKAASHNWWHTCLVCTRACLDFADVRPNMYLIVLIGVSCIQHKTINILSFCIFSCLSLCEADDVNTPSALSMTVKNRWLNNSNCHTFKAYSLPELISWATKTNANPPVPNR